MKEINNVCTPDFFWASFLGLDIWIFRFIYYYPTTPYFHGHISKKEKLIMLNRDLIVFVRTHPVSPN